MIVRMNVQAQSVNGQWLVVTYCALGPWGIYIYYSRYNYVLLMEVIFSHDSLKTFSFDQLLMNREQAKSVRTSRMD